MSSIGNLKTPYLCARKNDWKGFVNFFLEDQNWNALTEPIDEFGNTPLHLAASCGIRQLFVKLFEIVKPTDRLRTVVRMKNNSGNTLLHVAAIVEDEQIADSILKVSYDDQPNKEDVAVGDYYADEARLQQLRHDELLLEKNTLGETPVYRAASFGRTKLLKFFLKRPGAKISDHLQRKDKMSILHIAVITQNFGTAIWLQKNYGENDEELAKKTDDLGMTAFQLLATMTSAFKSQFHMGTFSSLIYYLLPEYQHAINIGVHEVDTRKAEDVESGQRNRNQPPIEAHIIDWVKRAELIRIWHAMWIGLAKEWWAIDELWKKKEMHSLAEDLVELLVQKDTSWVSSVSADHQALSKAEGGEEGKISKENQDDKDKCCCCSCSSQAEKKKKKEKPFLYTNPLLTAAGKGITEIVENIIYVRPQAIEHVSEDGQNIFFVAAKHHQNEIFRIIKTNEMAYSLAGQIDNEGNTLLHHTAYFEEYQSRSGFVIQLQKELRWFNRVRKRVPSHYISLRNKEGETPEETFEKEHRELLKNAQEWIKESAQSCSTVAVLVATVVFAASFTVPGGTNEQGLPIFLKRPFFKFFDIMDVVSLASSLASVVTFLSILSSNMKMWDFHKTLSRKLATGFALLFFSMATTMLVFSATVLLSLRSEKDTWTSSFIYIGAAFPVAFLGMVRLPVYVGANNFMRSLLESIKVVVPRHINDWATKYARERKRKSQEAGFLKPRWLTRGVISETEGE